MKPARGPGVRATAVNDSGGLSVRWLARLQTFFGALGLLVAVVLASAMSALAAWASWSLAQSFDRTWVPYLVGLALLAVLVVAACAHALRRGGPWLMRRWRGGSA